MAVPLILKRTSVPGRVPTTDNIGLGDIAFNTYDGKIYIKKSQSGTDSVVEVTGGVRSVNGASGETISLDTDDVNEGSVNFYYQDSRARAAISAGSGLAYNSGTGVVALNANTDLVSEGSTNLYFTNARARSAVSAGTGISYNSATGVITLDTTTVRGSISAGTGISYNSGTGVIALNANTDQVSEGSTNLYFTNARARSAVSAGTGISYNSATGVITCTVDTSTFVSFTGSENVSNKTLISTTLQSVKESVVAIGNTGTSKTINLTNGNFQTATLTGNCTFTMPALEAGKYFSLLLKTGAGGYTASFTGVKFSDSISPTITATASRADLIAFVCDGTYWYGNFVQNYSV